MKHLEQRLEKILFELDHSITELYSQKNSDSITLTEVKLDSIDFITNSTTQPALIILKYLEDLEHVLVVGKNIVNSTLKAMKNNSSQSGGRLLS